MLPPLVVYHHMSYLSQIYRRCSNTLLTPCLQSCTYQFPQRTLYISYRYLHTHVLLENKQFILLIDIPIQNRFHQITVHQVFTLDIPYGNYSVHYDINTRYFEVTKDVTMRVELTATQFQICQQANGQFCHISMPFQPLANPPTCIAALYTKSKAGTASKCSLQLCKTTTTALPYSDNTRCLDTYYTSYSSNQHSNSDMSRETHGNNHNLATNTHTEATHSLQCHFLIFLPAP